MLENENLSSMNTPEATLTIVRSTMKAMILSALALISFASVGRADTATPALTTLSCIGTNGVYLKSVTEGADKAFKISTAWGFARKEFDAKITSEAAGAPLQINLLDSKKNTEYILLINADASKVGANQTASGVIMMPGANGGEAHTVTYVRCEYTIQ